MEITGVDTTAAEALLQEAGWQVKTAVVMGLAGINAAEAQRRLQQNGGHVRTAIQSRSDD
jgi:N-acetylmuramic acid 6-phosphate etherase